MAIHAETAEKLEDEALVEKIVRAINKDYSRRYIERRYNVTRRLIERIKRQTMK
jgi:hypothetical protein